MKYVSKVSRSISNNIINIKQLLEVSKSSELAIKQKITSFNYVGDPNNCTFHTVMSYGIEAGGNAKTGSELGFTHGIVSDIVSDLITESTKPSNASVAIRLVRATRELISPIAQPLDDSPFDFNDKLDTQLNAIPLDSPWYI